MPAHQWGGMVASLARNLSDRDFRRELATAGLRADGKLKADELSFFEAYPEARRQTVPLGDVRYRVYNMDPMEQYCLAAMAGVRQPRTVFEIGTFDGATCLLLARVLPDATLYTLDLPPDDLDRADPHLQRQHAKAGGTGSRFRDRPEGARITQLYGDSRSFDFSAWYGQVDMVVVDGGHSADCVVPDSEHALRMLAPGGLIVWDDYTPHWPDVVAAVDDPARRHARRVVRLLPTEIAVYDSAKWPPAAPRGAGTGPPT